jgi:hypothetical protein
MGLLRKKRFDSYAAFPVVKAAHPRFALMQSTKTWMAGPSPAMTTEQDPCPPDSLVPQQALRALQVPEHRDTVQHAGQIGTIR